VDAPGRASLPPRRQRCRSQRRCLPAREYPRRGRGDHRHHQRGFHRVLLVEYAANIVSQGGEVLKRRLNPS
jgi:hypothetical protein